MSIKPFLLYFLTPLKFNFQSIVIIVAFFDSYHLPAELKGIVESTAQKYLESAQWLAQYDETYCNQGTWTTSSLVDLRRLAQLKYVIPGAHNQHATAIVYHGCYDF